MPSQTTKSMVSTGGKLEKSYRHISESSMQTIWLVILGLPVHIVSWIYYKINFRHTTYQKQLHKQIEMMRHSPKYEELLERYRKQYRSKKEYFNEPILEDEMEQLATQLSDEQVLKLAKAELANQNMEEMNYHRFFQDCLQNKLFLVLSFIPGIFMYLYLLIYSNPFIRYIAERIVMTIFVIVSVTIFVFTMLYFSPTDPAANILGEAATMEQREEFNRQYGLDQPYHVQLWQAVKGILSFDLGYSYTGNEDVMTSIANRFPITLIIALWSLLMAIVIAIPIGMISAARMNTFWDYTLMFIALIGLSIPNFWQGLIFILNFSINWGILPATYSPSNWLSIIMPVIVLGTGLTASIARMTRSSILEVINEDYIITAKAKGLKPGPIFVNHALRNAMIPIITLVGLQFGGMLGGAAVTEKVFNISGIGSYIVDKQFIPDIPAVLGGVVYIAIVISLVNLLVDILYALLNPRIRSQMKNV